MLLIALTVGPALGAIGAAANTVKTWDEALLWVIGGMAGGVLSVVGRTGILLGGFALFGLDTSVPIIATAGLFFFGTAALFGAVVAPLLDDTDSLVAWLFSFLIKWMQSPMPRLCGGQQANEEQNRVLVSWLEVLGHLPLV